MTDAELKHRRRTLGQSRLDVTHIQPEGQTESESNNQPVKLTELMIFWIWARFLFHSVECDWVTASGTENKRGGGPQFGLILS